jgi:cytochrome c5
MRTKIIIATSILALLTILCAASYSAPNNVPNTLAVQSDAQRNAMLIEGEKRFRVNCGRCHASPQKFPPRMMATIVRHMRVRATITDEDMRLVLFYMTQ